jgi:flagellar motor component MotA
MNRKTFFKKTADLIQKTLQLNNKVKEGGISSLENEIFDCNDEDLSRGLSFIVDEANAAIIGEYMSNKISFIKDKHTRIYKTILKRAVLGIQAQENSRNLFYILASYAGFTKDEQLELETLIYGE